MHQTNTSTGVLSGSSRPSPYVMHQTNTGIGVLLGSGDHDNRHSRTHVASDQDSMDATSACLTQRYAEALYSCYDQQTCIGALLVYQAASHSLPSYEDEKEDERMSDAQNQDPQTPSSLSEQSYVSSHSYDEDQRSPSHGPCRRTEPEGTSSHVT